MIMAQLQERLERQATLTVEFHYYPGAHWDCKLTAMGKNATLRWVVSEPNRGMLEALLEAVLKLEMAP